MKTTWKPFCTSWTIAWNSQHTEGVKLHNNEWEESVYDDMVYDIVSKNFAETLELTRDFDVAVGRHKHRTHHTPLIGARKSGSCCAAENPWARERLFRREKPEKQGKMFMTKGGKRRQNKVHRQSRIRGQGVPE